MKHKTAGPGPARGSLHRVTVTDFNNLGNGIARVDGKVIFVQHAIDGDEAEIQIIKTASDYCVARMTRILEPSPWRIASACPSDKRCGGCIGQSMDYAHELELKRVRVEAAFRKNGFAAEEVNVEAVRTTGVPEGWRNKIQLPVGWDAEGKAVTGYYAPHSHEIIPCEACLLQDRRMDDIIRWLREALTRRQMRGVRHLFLRSGSGGILVCLVMSEPQVGESALAEQLRREFPAVTGVLASDHPEEDNTVLGKTFRLLSGEPYLEDTMLGLTYRIAPGAFWQVNHDAAALALELIRSLAAPRAGDRMLDLYCGTGVIGLTLASSVPGASLEGVEVVPEAVENARENAVRNGIANAHFRCADAAEVLNTEGADIVIADPPRSGCDPVLLHHIAASAPRAFVYMSCNPDTLARDAALLREDGYDPARICPVDMFPRTGHVETVVLMSRVKE